MKQKLIDDAAKAALANNGAPLSISENDEIVRQIRSEADQAHAEMLDSMGMVPKSMFSTLTISVSLGYMVAYGEG